MASNIGTAAFVLSTNSNRLFTGLDQSKARIDQFRNQTNRGIGSSGGLVGGLSNNFGKLATMARAAAGPILAVSGAVAAIASTIPRIQDLAKQGDLANAMGVSVPFFTGMIPALRRYGLEAGNLQEALVNLSTKSKEALSNDSTREAFKKLGIDAKEFQQIPLEDKFKAVQAGLSKMKDKSEAVAIAIKLLGEEQGKKMAPLLLQSKEAFDKLTTSMSLSAAQMKVFKGADEGVKRVTSEISRLWTTVSLAAAPVIDVVANGLGWALEKVNGLVEGLVDRFLKAIGRIKETKEEAKKLKEEMEKQKEIRAKSRRAELDSPPGPDWLDENKPQIQSMKEKMALEEQRVQKEKEAVEEAAARAKQIQADYERRVLEMHKRISEAKAKKEREENDFIFQALRTRKAMLQDIKEELPEYKPPQIMEKGSRELIAKEAEIRTKQLLNSRLDVQPEDWNRQQLQEQRRGNRVLNQMLSAIQDIKPVEFAVG